jgi:hypothetical protein
VNEHEIEQIADDCRAQVFRRLVAELALIEMEAGKIAAAVKQLVADELRTAGLGGGA